MLRRSFLYGAVALIALSLVSGIRTTPAHAQSTQQPEVYVTDLHLDKDTYAAGDFVNGSFVLTNAHPEMNVPDIMYEISLVGNYGSNGIPQVFYDTQTFGPEFLKTSEPHKLIVIDYKYKIPPAFSGSDLGIHVQAMLKSGLPLGFTDKHIKVTGGLSTVTINSANLAIGTSTFTTQVGPTIYKDQKATLELGVSNANKEALTLTPHIIVYDRSTAGKVLKTYDEADVTLNANTAKHLSYNLLTFDYKAGVYLGELTFVDAKGTPRSTPTYFRYIVAGNIATITGITTQTTSVKKGDLINLTLNYAGTPYDIQTADVPASSPLSIDMRVFNENDRMVGIYSGKMDFNQGTSKKLMLKSLEDAQAMRVNVLIKDGDTVMSIYTANLSPDYDAIRANSRKTSPSVLKDIKTWYIIIPIVAVIILLIGFMIIRNRNSRKISMMLLGLLVAGGMFITGSHQAHAYSQTFSANHNAAWNYFWVNDTPNTNPGTRGYHPFSTLIPWYHPKPAAGSFVPNVTVSAPTNNQSMNPGQSFYVQGTLIAWACLNTPQDMMIQISFQGVTKTQYFTQVNDVDVHSVDANGQHLHGNSRLIYYSLGPFTAPSTKGSYNINIHTENYTNIPNRAENATARSKATQRADPILWNNGTEVGTNGGEATGYQTIMVTAPTPTVDLNANPTSVVYNGSSKLTWTSTNATSCTGTNFTPNGTSNTTGISTGNLTASKTYTIVCTGPGGNATDSATVTVNGTIPAPTITFYASPTRVNQGESTNLTWSSQNANTCAATSAVPSNALWTGNNIGTAGNKLTSGLPSATVFTITCTGNGGSTSKSVTVNVDVQTPAPTVDISASPQTINYNTTSTLTWTSTNATACTATSANPADSTWTTNSSKALSGSQATAQRTANTTYSITCTGAGGTASDSVTVNVVSNPPPVSVNLTSTSYQVTRGGNVTLTWTPQNAIGCMGALGTGYPTWATNKSATGGTFSVNNLTATTQFKINCTGSGGDTASDTVTIVVVDTPIDTTCRATDANGNAITAVRINTPVFWRVTNPVAGATFVWRGTDLPDDAAHGNPPYTGNPANGATGVKYTTEGPKTATVTITLTDGSVKTGNCSTNLTIKGNATFQEI